jgi:pimeloyl-ACP methyl ester carboxylesterase
MECILSGAPTEVPPNFHIFILWYIYFGAAKIRDLQSSSKLLFCAISLISKRKIHDKITNFEKIDMTLNSIVEGQGSPIVFIHGFCESLHIWDFFIPHFTAQHLVIRIDLPGHGQSAGLGYETSVEKMAFQLKETLDSLHMGPPVLVGHSLGGYVALAYAEMFPDHIKGLCLFHSTAFEDSPEKKENRNKTIEFVEKHGVEPFTAPFVPGLFFHKRRELMKEKIDFAIEIARQMNKENIISTIGAMRDRKNRIDVLKELRVPFALIAGKDDTAVTLDKSIEQCHLALQSHVLFLGETAHMGLFEREEACKNFLSGFFKTCE